MGLLVGSSAVTDIAAKVVSDLAAGQGGKYPLGSQDQAFSWAAGLPACAITQVSSAVQAGKTWGLTVAKPSGTPVTAVAAGADKPLAVSLDSRTITAKKYAGYGSTQLENLVYTAGVESAMLEVLLHGCLLAAEADLATEVETNAGHKVTGATTIEAGVLTAMGQIATKGGAADLLVLPASDFATVLGRVGTAGVYQNLDRTADLQPSLFGLRLVLSPSATKPWVLSRDAVLVGEVIGSPFVLVDPYGSNARKNLVDVYGEWMGAAAVIRPGSVATVAVTST